MNSRLFVTLVVILLSVRCTEKSESVCIVTIYTTSNTKGVLYKITQVPFLNEDEIHIDSVHSSNIKDKIIFKIKADEQRLFKITMSTSDMVVHFVNDVSKITIHVDYFDNTYSFKGTTVNTTLKKFEDEQSILRKQVHTMSRGIRNLKRIRPLDPRIDSLTVIMSNKLQEVAQRYVGFADTIKSPAAFMFTYNQVDFGDDRTQLKNFINRAAQRFPDYLPIKTLQKKTLQYIRILEEEYEVGQLLPDLTLPDNNGEPFSIQSLRGKVVFVDFWSTWCSRCLLYNPYKKKAKQIFQNKDFEIVSVALDDNLDLWRNIIKQDGYGYQLIDKQMWEGVAASTWKFDSIPYNFLISEDGYIVKKAIPPDSLISTLSVYIGE